MRWKIRQVHQKLATDLRNRVIILLPPIIFASDFYIFIASKQMDTPSR